MVDDTQPCSKYIYFHKDCDGVVVYVGQGMNERCLTLNLRSDEHKAFMVQRLSEVGLGYITIMENNLNTEEAKELEIGYIKEYLPKYNKHFTGWKNLKSGAHGENNRLAKLTQEQADQYRVDFGVSGMTKRGFHRDHVPEITWAAFRKLINGLSYRT